MILLVQLVVVTLCVWAFVQGYWRRSASMQARAHALAAVVLSSGSAGIWAIVVAPHLPSYPSTLFSSLGQPSTIGTLITTLIGSTALFALVSLGPNLVGMAIVSTALARRRHWLRACQSGGFIPVGAVYGLGVLLASLLPILLPMVIGGGLEPLLSIVAASFFYAPAILSGITAVGTYALLERSTVPTALPSST
jgi:hypothetical protein